MRGECKCETFAAGLRDDFKDSALALVSSARGRAVEHAEFTQQEACLGRGSVAAAREAIEGCFGPHRGGRGGRRKFEDGATVWVTGIGGSIKARRPEDIALRIQNRFGEWLRAIEPAGEGVQGVFRPGAVRGWRWSQLVDRAASAAAATRIAAKGGSANQAAVPVKDDTVVRFGPVASTGEAVDGGFSPRCTPESRRGELE